MKATAPEPGLSFAWRDRDRFPWLLFACVVLSFAAHAGSFLIFQVVYPQRATLPPPPPQVQLLSPAIADYEATRNWIDAEDPALVAGASSVMPAGLLEVPYRPSYSTPRTAPRSVPETAASVQFPAVKSPLSIIRSGDGESAGPARPPEPLPTRATFSPSLTGRTLTHAPEFNPKATASTPVEPSQFLIGVTGRGEVRFVFRQHTSGNPQLDEEAARALAASTFATGDEAVTWAHATVTWGDEVFPSNLKSEIRNLKSE